MQRVLQILQFRGVDEGFQRCVCGFLAILGFGLRFFVLGFGELFGERVYILIGKAYAVAAKYFLRIPRFRIRARFRGRDCTGSGVCGGAANCGTSVRETSSCRTSSNAASDMARSADGFRTCLKNYR